MSKQLKDIQAVLIAKAENKNIDFFSRAVPGEQKIYGVKTPHLNKIAVDYKAYSFGLAEELWNSAALEERIIAIKIMEKTGKSDPARLLRLFKRFSKQVDNWAVCDGLGMQFLRGIVKTHADEIFELARQFNRSTNRWQRRLSLVMVEWYTRINTRLPEIKELVKGLENDEDYYVKKAVVWIKKNFQKGK